MSDFEVVSDERRRPALRGRTAQHPLWDAIRAGRTVLVAGARTRDYNSTRQNLQKQGFRLFTRKEPDGVLLWAEPIYPDPEATE